MTDTQHLTQGPVRQQLIALAVPMLAGDILQQLYNTVDAVIVGRFVGDSAFAAVGVAGSVMNLFLFLISGCCAGVGVLLAQLYGGSDHNTFRRNFFLAALFGGLATLGLTGTGLLLLPRLLDLLQTPGDILSYAIDYLTVIFLGFLAAFAFHLCSAVLRAVGNTRSALFFLMVSMAGNLALDLLFIAVLDWGVAGAAWATVIAQGAAALLCLGYLALRFPQLMFHRADMVYDGALLRRTARFGLVSALHMASVYIGKLLVQRTVNGLGTPAISAFTAATRVEGFANSFGNSGCAAVSVFVGQNTGAKDLKRVRAGYFTGQQLLSLLALIICSIMLLTARPCLELVLPENSTESLGPALGYYRLVTCFYLFNFLGSGLSGYFQGRGLVNIPVLGSSGHLTIRVILSIFLAPVMGLPGVALASGLGWVWVVMFWSFLFVREQRAAREGRSFSLFPSKQFPAADDQ